MPMTMCPAAINASRVAAPMPEADPVIKVVVMRTPEN
jgi:hypothetical protein